MLRQTVSATSRALRSTARLGTQRQTVPFAQSYQTPFAVVRAIAVAPRARWYSSETDAAKADTAKADEPKSNEEEVKKEGEAESPEAALKKQLEAKEAELREMKVRLFGSFLPCTVFPRREC
jgi:molecular chaperone GrpE